MCATFCLWITFCDCFPLARDSSACRLAQSPGTPTLNTWGFCAVLVSAEFLLNGYPTDVMKQHTPFLVNMCYNSYFYFLLLSIIFNAICNTQNIAILLHLVTSCYILLDLVKSCYILLHLVKPCHILLHLFTSCYILYQDGTLKHYVK